MAHRALAVLTASTLAASALLAAAMPAYGLEAGGTSPTLRRIRETGTISLGHRESSIPFSYYDDSQRVIGYSHELMLKAVEAVKAELGLPGLRVKLTPVTSQNRIPLVLNGSVDLECGSTTNNTERQQQVAFSNTLFIVETRLLTRKGSEVKDFPDLAGKNVVTTAGTTSERLLRALNEEQKLGMRIVSAKDHGEAFLTLESGRAVAFMMDDALLAGEMAKARHPEGWHIVGTARSREAYGCMLPRGDAAFKKIVDDAIARAMTTGEAERLYRKWFQSPIPPRGLNLDLPLGEPMKALFRAPNDRALQ
jgi:glutamate/aspartate transport system substrate-binding protein